MMKRNGNPKTKALQEQRLKSIQNAASLATSFKAICMMTNLSYPQIKNLLSKNPNINNDVRNTLAMNRRHQTLTLDNFSKIKDIPNNELFINTQFIVLDASSMGVPSLRDLLVAFFNAGKKLIITSPTKRQLKSMMFFNDIVGDDAAFILSLIREFTNLCFCVNIDEKDCSDSIESILKYCQAHSKNLTLLTSNKIMARDAGCYKVPCCYIPFSITAGHKYKVVDFIPAKKFGEELILSLIPTDKLFMKLLSGNRAYTLGTYSLKIGDNILLLKRKQAFYNLVHYQIISLASEKNSELRYAIQITPETDVSKLPLKVYVEFVKEFSARYNIQLGISS